MFSDEPIRVSPTSGTQPLALERHSARRQFDLSVGIVALTLLLGIGAGVSQLAQHGFSTAPVTGYGIDEMVAKAPPASGRLRG